MSKGILRNEIHILTQMGHGNPYSETHTSTLCIDTPYPQRDAVDEEAVSSLKSLTWTSIFQRTWLIHSLNTITAKWRWRVSLLSNEVMMEAGILCMMRDSKNSKLRMNLEWRMRAQACWLLLDCHAVPQNFTPPL